MQERDDLILMPGSFQQVPWLIHRSASLTSQREWRGWPLLVLIHLQSPDSSVAVEGHADRTRKMKPWIYGWADTNTQDKHILYVYKQIQKCMTALFCTDIFAPTPDAEARLYLSALFWHSLFQLRWKHVIVSTFSAWPPPVIVVRVRREESKVLCQTSAGMQRMGTGEAVPDR